MGMTLFIYFFIFKILDVEASLGEELDSERKPGK